MKEIDGSIRYKDKEYRIAFNLNVMERIQEEYGTVEKWGGLVDGSSKSGEPDAKALIFGFTEMLNEGIDIGNDEEGRKDRPLTRRQVGRMVTEVGVAEAARAMNETIAESVEGGEKNA